ncbi:MAG: hypothetical protein A2X94_11265 [Bdellovibrionales bacterium GWB1_55_8]|nr:MAG: hypothetical protein A2X94_11265 [Bdellovibrionales bacterium GWB1_55_8]
MAKVLLGILMAASVSSAKLWAADSLSVRGAAISNNGLPVAPQQLEQQLVLVFDPAAMQNCGSQEAPSTKQASSLTSGQISDDGSFNVNYSAAELKQLTDPSCSVSQFIPGEIVTLRVAATIDPTPQNCQVFCIGRGRTCEQECGESGGIRANERFSEAELVMASSFAPSGEWTLHADLRFTELLPEESGSLIPDLLIPQAALRESIEQTTRFFDPQSCALEEGCISKIGIRRLLIFDTEIFNSGGSDLEIGPPDSQDPRFEYASCHGHYHLGEMVRYELLRSDDLSSVVVGSKLGFCLMDTERSTGRSNGRFDCGFQGISSGWSDIYDRSLDCQWLDVTDIPAGNYLLRLEVNPDRTILEGDYMNNSVIVPVLIPALFQPLASLAQQTSTPACELVEAGWGSAGQVQLKVETLVSGLEVPWGIGFLPGGDYLVTERPGRIRLVRGGKLIEKPVAQLEVGEAGEGGLLGIAIDPDFKANRSFFVYYTAAGDAGDVNRVERFRLSADHLSATSDRVILDNIPAGTFHDGGRLRFGPDGMLYVGTGDARESELAQQRDSLAGKILRITRDGAVPGDNPFPGSPAYILGIRNTQGFDWVSASVMAVTDHGPSGEMGRSGHDELSFARAGENLGWPDVWRCDSQAGRITPSLVWVEALPPGGALKYTGDLIPAWKGSLLIATLRSEHLQRVMIEGGAQPEVLGHEVYLSGDAGFGRLREIVQAPDGSIYVSTSNCDGRGSCGPEKDRILRLTAR